MGCETKCELQCSSVTPFLQANTLPRDLQDAYQTVTWTEGTCQIVKKLRGMMCAVINTLLGSPTSLFSLRHISLKFSLGNTNITRRTKRIVLFHFTIFPLTQPTYAKGKHLSTLRSVSESSYHCSSCDPVSRCCQAVCASSRSPILDFGFFHLW